MIVILIGAGVGSGCGDPEPEVFTVSKLTSSLQFLSHFEKCYEYQYASHKRYWVKELEKYLKGDIKVKNLKIMQNNETEFCEYLLHYFHCILKFKTLKKMQMYLNSITFIY